MKIQFPFKPINNQAQAQAANSFSPWPWPTCGNSTKTLSFRTNIDMFKTTNSAVEDIMGPTYNHSSSSQNQLISTTNPSQDEDDSLLIHGVLRSERLFFEPGETNSILEAAKSKPLSSNHHHHNESLLPSKERRSSTTTTTTTNVIMEEMVSTNPYVDFKKSMEEMLEANEGMKGSMEGLQELLSWYLTVNGKSNHGYIVGAFVDLLVSLSFSSRNHHHHQEEEHHTSSASNSPISALSFSSSSSSSTSSTTRSTTPCLSCSMKGGDHESSTSEKTLVALDNASSSDG